MKANAVPVTALFKADVRYEVPLFQRQYVWDRREQWEPFWDDLERQFRDHLERRFHDHPDGRTHTPAHFLGALVLEQQSTPATQVGRRHVVDGQQRLTTLQIFFAAWRDYCQREEVPAVADQLERLIFNVDLIVDPSVDPFKVWPTLSDRAQYVDVVTARSPQELDLRYPRVQPKAARRPTSLPRMVEAYHYFAGRLANFFGDAPDSSAPFFYQPLAERLEVCFRAMTTALRVVVIDLEADDDAQIIFETLNARGEPLLPADLVRNFIFLRATKQGENAQGLYDRHWKIFDEPFWREPVQQGRLSRPRGDLFMQCFLISQRGVDVSPTHLFTEYKDWLRTRPEPFPSVEAELKTLLRHGTNFRRLVDPAAIDDLRPLAEFLAVFEARTCYPLLLTLLELNPKIDWEKVTAILESYLLHRAVCGLSTKNYNRIFPAIIKELRQGKATLPTLRRLLLELKGDSSRWPLHAEFSQAWLTRPVYRTLNNARLVYIFKRLNAGMTNPKHETVSFGSLTVEHLMPQNWREHWPLPDGEKGVPLADLDSAGDGPAALATRQRDGLVDTLGNLTIITQSLNSSASDGAWQSKQACLQDFSLLRINHELRRYGHWDETTIRERGGELLNRAHAIWRQP